MASCSSTLATAISHRPLSDHHSTPTKIIHLFPSSISFFRHSFLVLERNSGSTRCRATTPGPPPPPQSEPPSTDSPHSSKGIGASLSRFKDTVQIFVAVLFWMSIFFWSSAWDGRNNDRTNKGSRFRK